MQSFVPPRSSEPTAAFIPMPGSRWMNSDRNGRSLATGPTGVFCRSRQSPPLFRRRRLSSRRTRLITSASWCSGVWRVTQGIYRFDPTTFDALWNTPVAGDIPAEVLFHLPDWCVYIPTPAQTWQGAALNGFFAHLESGLNTRRTELRLLLDVTGAAGDQLEVIPIQLGNGGVAAGVGKMTKEAARQFPVTMYTPDGVVETLSSDVSPLVSLVLYLSSQAAEIQENGGGKRVPTRPKPQKTKKGMRIFPPDHSSCWEVGLHLGAALKHALSEPRIIKTDRHPRQPSSSYPSGALAVVA